MHAMRDTPDKATATMRARGVDCSPEQVFITNGAQQGIDILGTRRLGLARCRKPK